jgi:hypothetical protein
MEQEKFQDLHDDGYIYTKVLGERFGCTNFNQVILCPNCKKELKVGNIEY